VVADGAGKGRLFLDPAKQHDDLRLLRRAIKKRWEIPEEFREVIVGRLRDIITEGDEEIALKAIAEVRQLESQNQRDEHKLVDVSLSTRNDRLDAIAADLGIDQGLIESIARETGVGDSGDATVGTAQANQ
jgi:hypothetical protein